MKCKLVSAISIWLFAVVLCTHVHAQRSLTVLVHWTEGERLEMVKEAAEEYASITPGIDSVDVIGTGSASPAEKMLVMLAADTPPDAVHIPASFVRDNTELFHPIPGRLEPTVVDAYHPAALQLATFRGQYFGFPTEFQTPATVHNQRMFAAAGVPSFKGPISWDDVWIYAQRLTRVDAAGAVTQSGFSSPGGRKPLHVGWQLWSDGHNVISETGEPLLNSPPVVDLVSRMKEYVDRGILTTRHWNRMPYDEVAMTVNEGFMRGSIALTDPEGYQAGIYVSTPAPHGRLGRPHVRTYGYTWSVPRLVEDPQPNWEFLIWLNLDVKEDGTTRMGDVLANLGSLPPSIADFNNQSYVHEEFIKGYLQALDSYVHVSLPDVAGADSWTGALGEALDRIYAGEISVINGLEEAQTAYRNRLAEAAAEE